MEKLVEKSARKINDVKHFCNFLYIPLVKIIYTNVLYDITNRITYTPIQSNN